MAKQSAKYDNFFNRRAKITANITAPTKISAFKSTETKMLLGESALEEIATKEKEEKTLAKQGAAAAQADGDSDDCLEFEDSGKGKTIGGKQSFKEFLAKKKISFTDRFGKGSMGGATDLMKRRKTIAD
mmetsp:Transcript_18862/g.25584  ORF Transcript_18862/g.25584 Transcript_18862/m.25584 type:complete len:129 (+) Transcript_18862:1348-1734(+)